VSAIFVLQDGELVEMLEERYVAEDDLQGYLADHPELLSAEAPEDERRRWLLIRREMGVSDREEGRDRWSLDHLFVDQDAIPTLVEVKRSTDTRLRREVVGQMLDYAANATAYWDAGRLRSSFESRFNETDTALEALSVFLEDDTEAEVFWDAVAANLKERRLRLVFVADRIPPELRSIVEFLNEQLQLTQVIAVEVKQYVARSPHGDRVNIVPRIIGETEMARRVKRPGAGARRPRLTEEQFYALTREVYAPELAERVLAVYEHVKARGSRQTFGRGNPPTTTAWMGEHEDPEIANPLALTFWGDGSGIAVNMTYFRERRTPEEMARLVTLLRRLPGISDVLDQAVAKDYRTFCTLRADRVLATDEDLEAFKGVLDAAAVRASASE
jgi:hypothetical protein